MLVDFSFNGVGNDEYGVICVNFDSIGKSTHSGQTSTLSTELAGDGREFEIYDQKYKEPMSFNFQIVNTTFEDIVPEQERYISKWLCHQGEYSWMYIQEPRYADIYLKAIITNPKAIKVGGVVGLEYTVTTSSAVAFSGEYDYDYIFTTSNNENTAELYLFNDDECVVYPQLEITFNQSGNFTLKNSAEEDTTYYLEIDNVTSGETITIDCELPTIETSRASHDIWQDFNKLWFRLYDDYNLISVNLNCTMNIKYRETRRLVTF